MISSALLLATAFIGARAYWLMGIEDIITTERLDPVVSPGKVSSHVHSVLGGSNFRFSTNTAQLRQSECTSIPIPEDKSNYWFPHLYFQWANGSFTSLDGGAVIYYLFDKGPPGATTAFPDDFRMLSGDPTLRTYDPNSFAQQAVSFLCLDFNGVSTRHNGLPLKPCPSGVRAQINFPSCWDGKNVDSPDHKSHVAFRSGGPDSGSCSDPNYPVTLPRIFMEMYWGSNQFDQFRSQAMNTTQPFVFSYGDRTGYGYHADFINGWDAGVLQRAVDGCTCNDFGDATCCVDMGLFHMNQGLSCKITKSVDEVTTGTIPKLPGNNPVQEEGTRATIFPDTTTPAILAPVFAYTGASATQTGTVVTPATTVGTNAVTTSTSPSVMTPSTSTSTTISTTSTSTPISVPTSIPLPASPSISISTSIPPVTVPATTTTPTTAPHTTTKPTTTAASTKGGGLGITIPGIITLSIPALPSIGPILGIPL